MPPEYDVKRQKYNSRTVRLAAVISIHTMHNIYNLATHQPASLSVGDVRNLDLYNLHDATTSYLTSLGSGETKKQDWSQYELVSGHHHSVHILRPWERINHFPAEF